MRNELEKIITPNHLNDIHETHIKTYDTRITNERMDFVNINKTKKKKKLQSKIYNIHFIARRVRTAKRIHYNKQFIKTWNMCFEYVICQKNLLLVFTTKSS